MEFENKGELGISALAGQRVGNAPYGDPIRKQMSITPLPNQLHLVYITLDQGKLVIRHARDAINNNLVTEEERILKMAATGNSKSHFETIVFRYPCYFSVVLDIDGWEFYYPNPGDSTFSDNEVQDPIVFYDKKIIWVDDNGTWKKGPVKSYQQNRSFYSLVPTTPTLGGAKKKGIRCINHCLDKDGTRPHPERPADYGFNINLLVPFSDPMGLKYILVAIDPDGQNQGPVGFIEKGE